MNHNNNTKIGDRCQKTCGEHSTLTDTKKHRDRLTSPSSFDIFVNPFVYVSLSNSGRNASVHIQQSDPSSIVRDKGARQQEEEEELR